MALIASLLQARGRLLAGNITHSCDPLLTSRFEEI